MSEAIFNTDAVRPVGGADIEDLKRRAQASPRRRFRLCLHHDPSDGTQEMVICVLGFSYFRPHRHPAGRSESYHVIEGQMRVHILDEDGAELRRLDLAAGVRGLPFLYRLSEPLYHFVVPTSPCLVYHEVLTGPWQAEGVAIPAPFAPAEDDPQGITRFLETLEGGPRARSGACVASR